MADWKGELAQRVAEVNSFFELIDQHDQPNACVVFDDNAGNMQIHAIADDTIKILKATGFLVLYNLLESTIKNAIEAIFDEFDGQNVGFDLFRKEVQRVILANHRRNGAADLHQKVSNLATELARLTFNKSKLFSGNVDARKIREVAGEYGFSHRVSPAARNGGRLVTVKNLRNDLGHGDKSFREVGKEFTVKDLTDIKAETIAYVNDIAANVDDYILNKRYLANVPQTSAPVSPGT